MGTSNWQNISYCIELVREIKPNSILDIGVGFGRWGIVAREFLDVWEGTVSSNDWNILIEGIEAYTPNIEQHHNIFYNKIYNEDATNLLPKLVKTYNLIVLGDVLEHFDKQEGVKVLNKCIELGKYVLLNVPLGDNWEQGAQYDNQYEVHKSIWTESELDNYPTIRKRLFTDYIGRNFATYLFSKSDVTEDLLSKPTIIAEELKKVINELELLNNYKESLELRFKHNRSQLQNLINLEENKVNEFPFKAHNVQIKISSKKNVESQGKELWLYNISSNIIKYKNLEDIKRIGYWEIRKDPKWSYTENLLFSSAENSSLSFSIIGDELSLKVLKHSWSGVIEISIEGKVVKKVDLFSNDKHIHDIIINLKDEM